MMLGGCTAGMLTGLAVDAFSGRLATLTTVCASIAGIRSLPYWFELHWTQLPAMHAGMLVAGAALLAVAATGPVNLRARILEVIRSAVCTASMLIGMELGILATHMADFAGHPLTVMLAAMLAGMNAGLLAGSLAGGVLCGQDPG